jgi:dienelactone hydrolase
VVVCLLMAGSAVAQDTEPSLHEQVVLVPLPQGSTHEALVATTYRPNGDGPFPLLVLSHGSPANAAARSRMGHYRVLPRIREFTRRGFAVIVPMRRGYGETGGEWIERYGSCEDPDFYSAGHAAASDVLATVEFAATLPYVDRKRIVLLGQSAGGIASIAAASRAPDGVLAAVNFSGGRGGRRSRTDSGNPCGPRAMAAAIGMFATTIRIPVLWHYAENDRLFGPVHVREWFRAFEVAGARGKLVMQPPFGKDGHRMFAALDGAPLWTAAFDRFLAEIAFPLNPPQEQ